MTSTAIKLITLGSVGALAFAGTFAIDVYAAIRPDLFPAGGWAPFGVHSLLMTFSGANWATALIGWLLLRRNDEVYTTAYRHGAQDILNYLTDEEMQPLLLHQRRTGHAGHSG